MTKVIAFMALERTIKDIEAYEKRAAVRGKSKGEAAHAVGVAIMQLYSRTAPDLVDVRLTTQVRSCAANFNLLTHAGVRACCASMLRWIGRS